MTVDVVSELDLWASARAGDERALGEIFDRHHERVYARALWLLADPHDAQDATAIAFLELWRRRASVRVVGGSVLPWLLVTTGNASRNIKRSSSRYQSLLANLPRGSAAQSAESSAFARADLLNAIDPEIAAAMRKLRPDTFSLLILTAVDGLPIADAAEAVGLTVGAAKTRLSRARAFIRDFAPGFAALPPEGEDTL